MGVRVWPGEGAGGRAHHAGSHYTASSSAFSDSELLLKYCSSVKDESPIDSAGELRLSSALRVLQVRNRVLRVVNRVLRAVNIDTTCRAEAFAFFCGCSILTFPLQSTRSFSSSAEMDLARPVSTSSEYWTKQRTERLGRDSAHNKEAC